MKFIAFDGFKGLPIPKGSDKGYVWKQGDFNCGLGEFEENLIKEKVDLSRIEIISGWYEKTLEKEKKKGKIAVVFIDCDYYESAKLVLNYIKPKIQEGTVLVFDDYYCFKADPRKGERRAFNEFKEENKELFFTELPFHSLKKMFVCHKNGKPKSI